MIRSPEFELNTFMQLNGVALSEYVDLFNGKQGLHIPNAVYDALQIAILSLDNEHLVHAIELSIWARPSVFALTAVRYLEYPHASVCLTAFRSLSNLPKEYISEGLINSIKKTKCVHMYSKNPRTGEQLDMGSNEQFLAELVESLEAKFK